MSDNIHNSVNRQVSAELARHSADFEVCLVFPVHKETKKFTTEGMKVMNKLSTRIPESDFFIFYSKGSDEIYVLLRLDDKILKEFADREDLLLLTNPETLFDVVSKGIEFHGTTEKPENVKIDKFLEFYDKNPELLRQLNITNYGPFEYIYLEYDDVKELQVLYAKDEDYPDSPFANRHRIHFCQLLIDGPKEFGGLELEIKKLMNKKDSESIDGKFPVIRAFYPLHKDTKLKKLEEALTKGLSYLHSEFPDKLCNQYFGEKIALYYAFLKHFYDQLTITAAIGICVEVAAAALNNKSHPVVAAFSIYITLWGVYFTETWKRKEVETALKHGMIDFEKREANRVDFNEDEVLHIVGREELYYSQMRKNLKMFLSFLIITFLIACIIITTAFIFVFRAWYSGLSEDASQSASYIAAVMNSVQREIFTLIYNHLSESLTDSENHK